MDCRVKPGNDKRERLPAAITSRARVWAAIVPHERSGVRIIRPVPLHAVRDAVITAAITTVWLSVIAGAGCVIGLRVISLEIGRRRLRLARPARPRAGDRRHTCRCRALLPQDPFARRSTYLLRLGGGLRACRRQLLSEIASRRAFYARDRSPAPGPTGPRCGRCPQHARRRIDGKLRRIDGASGVHATFATEAEYRFLGDLEVLQTDGPTVPLGDPGYATFDHFLGALAARKRKTIRRERHDALANGVSGTCSRAATSPKTFGITFYVLHGETGLRKWGSARSPERSSLVGETMRDRILLIMAKRSGRWIAGAINFIGSRTLFGRHWGAIEHHPFLHFELCYYQAIDFAIDRKFAGRGAGAGRAQSAAATCR